MVHAISIAHDGQSQNPQTNKRPQPFRTPKSIQSGTDRTTTISRWSRRARVRGRFHRYFRGGTPVTNRDHVRNNPSRSWPARRPFQDPQSQAQARSFDLGRLPADFCSDTAASKLERGRGSEAPPRRRRGPFLDPGKIILKKWGIFESGAGVSNLNGRGFT